MTRSNDGAEDGGGGTSDLVSAVRQYKTLV